MILLSSYFSKSQVLEQDSLALVAIYNSTNGDNWTYNNYWLSYPVELWFGVEVSNNRVVKIDLNYNNLSGFIPEEIGDLDSLSYFSIHNNYLASISPSIGACTILDTLKFFSNPIDFLPPEIGNLSNLKYFSFGKTEISVIPDEIGGLINLEYLYGREANIQAIPETIGNLISIKEIDLALNNIFNFPSSIGNCTNLTKLHLNANSIPNVPIEIGNLINIEELILGGNIIDYIPNEIYTLTSLEKLNFAANNIDSISISIGNLVNLRNFQFFDNNITSIPEVIGELTDLTYIVGYGNRLTSLPLSLLDIPHISWLYMMYNRLTFEDIEPFVSISGFHYHDQDSIGFYIDTTINIDTPYYMEIQTGGDFNQYQWLKNGDTILGANEFFLEFPNISFADSGAYHCLVTNTISPNLTLYSRTIDLNIVDPLMINESESYVQFELYPNPNTGIFSININENKMSDRLILLVYNQFGVALKSFTIYQTNLVTIDISNLQPGLYYTKLYCEKKIINSETKKLILK